jgi:hypothetical protein
MLVILLTVRDKNIILVSRDEACHMNPWYV